MPFFKQVGLQAEIHAQQRNYDYALVHGGHYSRIVKRFSFLISEYERGVRFKTIVFLTGQRQLNTEEKSSDVSTEKELMLSLWENMTMPEEMRTLPLQIVDTPQKITSQGNWARPTTKDTLSEWLKTEPTGTHCLFISNQPFLGYQDSVARTYLSSRFTMETVGPQSDDMTPVAVYLDTLARWLYQEKMRRTNGPS